MLRSILPCAALLLAAACSRGESGASDTGAVTDTARTASATSSPAGGAASGAGSGASAEVRDSSGKALGTLTLTGQQGGISMDGHLTGLPAGEHGIHVHAVGQCTPPFESAGPHWNPTQKKHGTQNPQGPHLGDMPNVAATQDGSAHVAVRTAGGTLDSLLDADGASVVVHATADDYKTDPSGNSGGRIACGVVTRR